MRRSDDFHEHPNNLKRDPMGIQPTKAEKSKQDLIESTSDNGESDISKAR